MPSKLVTRLLSDKVERYTIWDNYARHVEELKAIGATDDDLLPLKRAAETVSAIEQQEALENGRNPVLEGRSLADLTAPYTCANSWVIQPPTAMARRYAIVAGLRVTRGVDPDDMLSSMAVIAVSLWCLRTWGEGRKDQVMHVVYGAGALAEFLPQLLDECDSRMIDQLISDYCVLMGLGPSQKKTTALAQYETLRSEIRTKLSRPSTAVSS